MHGRKSRGQGATEYLVVLGAVLLVAIVGVTTLNQASGAATLKEQQSTTYWKSATPFGIIAYVLNENALSITLSNNLNEKIKLTSIKVTYNGVNYTIYSENRVFAAGEQAEITNIDLRFSAANPCNTLQTGSPFEFTQVIFGYDKQSITGFFQTGDKPLVGKCGGQAVLVNVSGDSPSSGQSVAQNVSLNLTVQSSSLSAMNFSFNGTSTSFYDPSLVLAMDFEDNPLVGDNDTNVVDVSRYGNNGTVYDNTVGLWRFDETDNTTAADYSRFGNTGTIYGPTLGLWRFDEGDNTTVSDASNWGNNGTLYGSTLALWRFDEGDNKTVGDATAYGYNGTLYGSTLGLWRFDEGDNKTASDATAYANNGRLYGSTIGLWHLDENTGGTAADGSAYGNNGTCQTIFTNANCAWSTGKSGSSATFNGINTTVTLPEPLGGNYTSVSISLWTKTTQIVVPSGGLTNRSFTLYRYSGATYFGLGQTVENKTTLGWSGWSINLTSNGSSTNDGNWHHIVGVKNATATWLYQDGILVGHDASTSFTPAIAIIAPTIGGFNNTGITNVWNGSIDEVQLINATLTQADVTALYNEGKAKFLEWNASGKSGGAIEFDGITTYLNAGNGSALNSIGNFSTIMFWAKPDSFTEGSNYRGILSWKAQTGTLNIRVSSAGEMQARIYDQTTYGSGVTATIGAWDFWAFVINNSTWSWYKNGELTASGDTLFPINYTGNLTIGMYQGFGRWNGSIDELQIVNRSLSAAEVLAQHAAGKAKFAEWTTGKSGSAIQFDGTTGYYRTASQIPFNTTAVSFSAWVNARGLSNPRIGTVFADAGQGGTAGFVWIYRYPSSNSTVVQYANGTNYLPMYFMNYFTGYLDQWVHFAVTIDYASSNITMYRNGQVFGTNTTSNPMLGLTTSRYFYLGRYSSTDNSLFNGSIDEAAIYNRTLSPSDILELYNAGKAKFIEWNSSGKSVGAMVFDNSSFVRLYYGNNLNLSGALSLSAWVYPTTNDSFYRGVFGSGQAQDTINGRYLFFYRNGELRFEVSNGSARHATGYMVPALSEWYHVTGTWDGTNLTDGVRFYVNGENVANTTANFSSITSFKPWYFGRDSWSGATRKFIGMIDEAQAINYALNATEVANLYNAGKAKFVEHVPWGKSGSALMFDGVKSYVDAGNAPNLNVTGPLTMMAWINSQNYSVTEGSGSMRIMAKGNSTSGYYGYQLMIPGTNNGSPYGTGLQVQLEGPASGAPHWTYTLNPNTWYHVAVTFNGTNVAGYVNGQSIGNTSASPAPITANSVSLNIGRRANGDRYFNGLIDEAEVINRSLSASEIAAIYSSGRARRDSWDATGKAGSAMQFDGVDDYIDAGNSTEFNMSGKNFTLSAWANLAAFSSTDTYIISHTSTTTKKDFAIGFDTTKHVLFANIWNNTGKANCYTEYSVVLGVWTHIVYLFNGSHGKMYLNGVLANTSLKSFVDPIPEMAFPLPNVQIGERTSGSYAALNGSIDQVRIWKRALSDAEVAQQYYGSLAKYAPDSWIFSYNRTLVPAGTYYYYGYVRNADGSFDYTDNRSITVTG